MFTIYPIITRIAITSVLILDRFTFPVNTWAAVTVIKCKLTSHPNPSRFAETAE